jgi:hypothetical protein
MQSLSRWHVYAFTSNRNATICNIAIEKIVSYTQLLLLFNEIDHIAWCTCGQLSFVPIESIFFFSLSLLRQSERKEWVENICVRVDD